MITFFRNLFFPPKKLNKYYDLHFWPSYPQENVLKEFEKFKNSFVLIGEPTELCYVKDSGTFFSVPIHDMDRLCDGLIKIHEELSKINVKKLNEAPKKITLTEQQVNTLITSNGGFVPSVYNTPMIRIEDTLQSCIAAMGSYRTNHGKPTFFHYRQNMSNYIECELKRMKDSYLKLKEENNGGESSKLREIISFLYTNYKGIINNSPTSAVAKSIKNALTSILNIDKDSSHKEIYAKSQSYSHNNLDKEAERISKIETEELKRISRNLW